MYKEQDPNPISILFSKFIEWKGTGSQESCLPPLYQICDDESCSNLSSPKFVGLSNNPSKIDETTGIMAESNLVIKRSAPFNKLVYFYAKNTNTDLSGTQNVVKAIVIVCGNEKVQLKDKSNDVFNIKGHRDSNKLLLSYELKEIWAVDTDGLISTVDDCPIRQWKMCDDVLCEKETKQGWFSIEGSTLSIDTTSGIVNSSNFLAAITSGNSVGSHQF